MAPGSDPAEEPSTGPRRVALLPSGPACASLRVACSRHTGSSTAVPVGFFAVRPSAALLRAAELWAENLTFSGETGWGGLGFLPSLDKFVGAECGQGYFHALFYKQGAPSVRRAFRAAGVE
ncbi:unnamed protein product, partial [Prorocentrum cordatum]